MEYPGFGKNSGPSSSINPNSSQNFFRNVAPSRPNPSSSTLRPPRPFVQSSPSSGDAPRPFHYNAASHRQRLSNPSPTVMKSNVVASRTSEHGAFFKVSRTQQNSSRNPNQPVPIRSIVPSGGFRPASVGAAPISQYVPPRTQSPGLTYHRNNHNIEGFRPSSVGVGPVRHVARSTTNSPEMARRTDQYVDLDSSPTPSDLVHNLARPRTNSPELASRSNQFVGLHSLPPSTGAGSVDYKARIRTNSPELASTSHQFVDLDNFSSPDESGLLRPVVPPRTQSPNLDFKINHPVEGFHSSGGAPVRPAPFSSNSFVGRPRSPVSYASLHDIQYEATVAPYYDSESSKFDDIRGTNQTGPPDSQYDEISHVPQNNPKRPSFTHSPALGTIERVNLSSHDSRAPRKSLSRASDNVPEASGTNPSSLPIMKRSRSPPLLSGNKAVSEKSNDNHDDEREMLAKARRLARFKVELAEKVESSTDNAEQRVSTNLPEPSIFGRCKIIPEHSAEMNEDFSVELEGAKPSTVIIGLCTDMCPESERAERERKGDLDRYERLDGDRNQTSKSLAVKKYNRTAEREAHLIRPMPILKKTMEYLLNLLDKPYNDRFLGTYNFLWDRMRAIRMDLRMQHIFNQAAITMLEQMIRLHIIAMHELCEYSKGEGFSEGFDAHLNIEQMNKTSVELFQMYDDHRKNGVVIFTEKEFRGYYALLKLDKHPGYIVEPAELSLDLAKMTPEIRQTSEVLFARDVARACRTGNFIAFFRLARKASYLQACLMHAHFAKLRTQALASLHAGLQSTQGLPVVHVAKWLAMEDEDMESLLEYHGFLIKAFDELYMVKDGPFLNGDKDHDTRCSKLVDSKKSESIVEDVRSAELVSPPKAYQSIGRKIPQAKATEKVTMVKKNEIEPKVFPSDSKKRTAHDISPIEVFSHEYAVDEDMADYEATLSPKDGKDLQPIIEMPVPNRQFSGFNNYSSGFSFSKPLPAQISVEGKKPNFDSSFSNISQRSLHDNTKEIPFQFVSKPIVQDNLHTPPNFIVEKPVVQPSVTEVEEEEPPVFLEEDENEDAMEDEQDQEIAEAKLKLILRSWKRRASMKRGMREQRQFAANAALNSLPLGPLVQLRREPPDTLGEFDIDNALRERNQKHEQSWSRLNVSEEIAGLLSRKNPGVKCLCWKIVICSEVHNPEETETAQSSDSAVSSWLLSKLMPSNNEDDDNDLLVSSAELSIWKKWLSGQFHEDQICCLSVVKKVNFNNTIETLAGASAVLFLLRDSIPWNLQRANLQILLESIPSGSSLPLLILSSSFKDETLDHSSIVVNELGLLDIDKSKISTFFVLSLTENQQMEDPDGFFSDNQLRQGLQWLASESPSQLVLHRVKTRELVLTHLRPSLETLERRKIIEVNPNDCVLAFNQALDQSLGSIDAAAKANGNSWPCPEVSCLEESSIEHRIAEFFLPENGWNSVDRIRSLMSALQDCKLPVFEDNFSYLSKGSNSGEEVKTQRAEFGNSLIRYLSELSTLMGYSLAINEAEIMLQSCQLELHRSYFHIVPNWVMIFRRIFNWRLMSLSEKAFSSAYVLERPDIDPPFDSRDGSGHEDDRLLFYHINQPTLDEMIEVSFRPTNFGYGQPQLVPNGEDQETIGSDDLMEDDFEDDRECRQVVAGDITKEVVVAGKVDKEADRLSNLLEKCNILQNIIDEKLSVYF